VSCDGADAIMCQGHSCREWISFAPLATCQEFRSFGCACDGCCKDYPVPVSPPKSPPGLSLSPPPIPCSMCATVGYTRDTCACGVCGSYGSCTFSCKPSYISHKRIKCTLPSPPLAPLPSKPPPHFPPPPQPSPPPPEEPTPVSTPNFIVPTVHSKHSSVRQTNNMDDQKKASSLLDILKLVLGALAGITASLTLMGLCMWMVLRASGRGMRDLMNEPAHMETDRLSSAEHAAINLHVESEAIPFGSEGTFAEEVPKPNPSQRVGVGQSHCSMALLRSEKC